MKLNRRALAAAAATGVAAGALAAGGVALAATSSPQSPQTSTAAAIVAAATARPAPAASWCAGGPGALGGPWGAGFGFGPLFGQQMAKATAAYLGISQDDLLNQLKSGKSLAAVATSRGKPVSGLENAILTAATSQINASTGLTTAQKAELVSVVKSHLDTIVNATYPAAFGPPAFGPGWPGHGGW